MLKVILSTDSGVGLGYFANCRKVLFGQSEIMGVGFLFVIMIF